MKCLLGLAITLLVPLSAHSQALPTVAGEEAQQPEALALVKVAAVVADHVRHRSLNHYVGLYVSPENWASAGNDSWIGSFFKVKYAKPKPGRSAACVFSAEKDIALCVYFDGETPFGLATVKVGVSGRIDPYRVASSYEGLGKRLLKASEQKLDFIPIAVATDEGRPLPAFELRKHQGAESLSSD